MAWPLFASVPQYGVIDRFGYGLSACGQAQTVALGNWTTYTNAEGRVYTMSYDAMGRLLAATNAANEQVFANRYDPAGNLTNRLDGAGNTTIFTYDELNRIIAQDAFHHEEHEGHEGFAYDAVGNLLTASNAVVQNSFAYDVMDRLSTATTTISNHQSQVAYHRDHGGLVTNLVYAPNKAVARTYGPDGHLVAVSDWLGHT